MTTTETASLTKDAVDFAVGLTYDAIPEDALKIARRCVLDGLAVMVGGSEQPALEVMARYIDRVGGTPDARLLGNANKKVPEIFFTKNPPPTIAFFWSCLKEASAMR